MGTLYYGASRTPVRMDDRALAHLQMVITTKLRRGEGFMIHWDENPEGSASRGGMWIHTSCDLAYEFVGAREPSLDKEELDRMMLAASANSGLRVMAELASWDLPREAEQVA